MERAAGSDCIVIGGGLIGLSTALHLGRGGASVDLLERGRIGDGTSSKASGWISAQLRTPNELLALVLASLAYYPAFLASLDDDCGYERTGSLIVFDSVEGIEQRRDLDRVQREVPGYAGTRFLDAREVHELEPVLAPSILGGAHFDGDAQVEPLRLLDAMVRAAPAAGVRVHQGADVTAIARAGGRWRATTALGEFDARTLVVTAGAWSPAVGELAGTEIPVIPVAGQLVVTEPRPGVVRHCVVYQPDARFATKLACGVRPATDGRMWLGTTYRAGTFDTSITAQDTREILGAVAAVFPALEGVPVREAWAGVRPVPADLVPIYGRAPGLESAFIGVPVAGLAECAAAGRMLAELIAGAPTSIDAAPYSPDRSMERD